MKKKIITVISLVLVIAMMCCNVSVLAASVTPRWTNCDQYSFTFSITDDGTAHVRVGYTGDSNKFAEARLTVQLEKRFLLVFWNTVDIGYPNDEWTETSTELYGNFYNSFALSDTGTYRAVMTLEIVGKDGSVDVIEDKIEYKYE